MSLTWAVLILAFLVVTAVCVAHLVEAYRDWSFWRERRKRTAPFRQATNNSSWVERRIKR